MAVESNSSAAVDHKRSVDWIILALIVVLAGCLRGWYVPQPLVDVFSWRQASTAMIADNFRLGSWNIFFPEVSWTGPGPSYQGREFQLFTYIVAILHAVFGWHDWIGRLVATLFGLVTVFSVHRLAALIWDERHAHAVAFSYAVMPAAIIIDSSFLPDPAMLALITLGLWLFVRHWIYGGWRDLLLGASAFTLGALTKLPGLGAGLVVAWLIVVWLARGEIRPAIRAAIAAIAGMILVFSYYAWAVHLGNSYPPYHVAGDGYVWDWGLSRFWEERFFIDDLWGMWVWWYFGYVIMAMIALGFWTIPPLFEGRDGALVAVPLVWLVGGILVYLAGAREISNNPWNLHVLHVPAAFLCGRGIIALTQSNRVKSSSVGDRFRLVVILSVMLTAGTFAVVPNLKKSENENALYLGRSLDRLAEPDDLVIAISPQVGDPVAIYYSRRRGWVFPPGGGDTDWASFVDDDNTAITQLEDLRHQGARWFGVTWNARDSEDRSFFVHHTGIIEHLEATGTRVDATETHVIYRLDPPS